MKKINLLFLLILFYSVANAQCNLNLKIFIEGYYTGNGLMDNFGAGGCLFINSISTNVSDADCVQITVIDPVTLMAVESKKGILKTNGPGHCF